MNKNILYIGNNLNSRTKYPTALVTLVLKLKEESFDVVVTSNKSNKLVRLLDMILSTILNSRKADYILIDTYSTTNFYYALIISQLSRLLRIKYIPILHGGNLTLRLKNNKFLSKLIFKYSYKNVAPSNYLKSVFENYGYQTINIPNSIDINSYTFKKRNLLEPKLFWVRSFKNIYNPVLALKVLLLLKKEYQKASLCMVGPFLDDTYQESLSFVKKNNLENSVEFTNVLSKEDWHQKSQDFDIFINTTNIDNTPVSVIEAMALGLIVISTNVGGVPFLIDDKKDGILVEPNNAIQMKETIIALLEGKHSEVAVNARKKVEMFDWNVVRDKWLEILK